MKKSINIIIALVLILLTSCGEIDSEINVGTELIEENKIEFQIEFDNQTFTTNNAKASIIDGVTVIKAINISNETILIILNQNTLGEYTFIPNENMGKIVYKKEEESSFYTSPFSYSGRVDLTTIDEENSKISGNFSFSGIKIISQLDAEENPIADVYTKEIKNFANGVFTNIPFSITEEVDSNLEAEPSEDSFYVKVDDTEFVETSIVTEKVTIDEIEVLKIIVTNDTGRIEIQVPASTIVTNEYTLDSTSVDPTIPKVTYTKIETGTETLYSPYVGLIDPPKLTVIKNNTHTKKLDLSFQFSASDDVNVLEITEGRLSVIYTE